MFIYNIPCRRVKSTEGQGRIVIDVKFKDDFRLYGKGKDDIEGLLFTHDVNSILADMVEPIVVDTANPLDRYYALAIKKEFVKEVLADNLPPATSISARGNRVWSF